MSNDVLGTILSDLNILVSKDEKTSAFMNLKL